jgi:iron only hydrogenase large subunit-like protein
MVKMELSKLIRINEEKCINCHQCIAACPVKFANDGSDKVVHVNHNLCIGCGQCIHACTHKARFPTDDFDSFLNDLVKQKDKMIAVVAPAVASNFPRTYLKLNGWLKSLGIEAFFDVSFGAELTVKSYIEHVKTNAPKAVIAQPCPAIVSYIQIYKPSLLQYLAPADSPMLHTIKMVKQFYPKYQKHKVVVISPCIAKKREFDETGLGDYNVTISSIINYLESQKINLKDFPDLNFDNDSAERAVLFSTPGGLLETAEREVPQIRNSTRKIEGVHTIYNYLNYLEDAINKGFNPTIIDCLNCELGCNGGTGTQNHNAQQDELEFYIKTRKDQLVNEYRTEQNEEALNDLRELINKYWVDGLYSREYQNYHKSNYEALVKTPNKNEMDELLQSMAKYSSDDLKNCASCGYNNCEEMAKAIFNGYNKKENCHFFLVHKVDERTHELISNTEEFLEVTHKVRTIIG